jgi:hypothetical protein
MLKTKLLQEHSIYAAHFYHADRWWTRASAQVWNEVSDKTVTRPRVVRRYGGSDVSFYPQISDFEKLGRAFLVACEEILSMPDLEEDVAS